MTASSAAKKMEGRPPPETLPPMGTSLDPVVFGDDQELLLCYEIAPARGGGYAILAFVDIFHVEINPFNSHGRCEFLYPFSRWDFTEVIDSDLTERWCSKLVSPRFWTISSNDYMYEIVFKKVSLVHENHEAVSPRAALLNYAIRNNKTWTDKAQEDVAL